jgi:hypothetical protein
LSQSSTVDEPEISVELVEPETNVGEPATAVEDHGASDVGEAVDKPKEPEEETSTIEQHQAEDEEAPVEPARDHIEELIADVKQLNLDSEPATNGLVNGHEEVKEAQGEGVEKDAVQVSDAPGQKGKEPEIETAAQ